MKADTAAMVTKVVAQFGARRDQLLPIIQAIMTECGYVSKASVDELASKLKMHRVEIEDMVSFYSFFSREPQGAFRIRLSRTPISLMQGAKQVAEAFEQTTGCSVGNTSDDGLFTLESG